MEKGELSVGYIPNNKFILSIPELGVGDLKIIEVSGIEQELETVELPDKTVATSGRAGIIEFTIKIPAHEDGSIAAINRWFMGCRGNVASDYKKDGTLTLQNTFGTTVSSWTISGMFPTKRTLPELNSSGAGDLTMAEWAFKADDVVKI
jgi:hypothetical protein